MTMRQRLVAMVQRWRRHRACNRIRTHLAWLGFPIDATDDEIEARCFEMSFVLRGAGVSAEEAAEGLMLLREARLTLTPAAPSPSTPPPAH